MNEFTWKNEKINEMQEKAYQVCKRLFALYIKNYKKQWPVKVPFMEKSQMITEINTKVHVMFTKMCSKKNLC